MSDETREVQYDEGEESLVLEDGQIAERGVPIVVSADLAERLCSQSIWWDLSVGKEQEAAREAEEVEAKEAEKEAREDVVIPETPPEPTPAESTPESEAEAKPDPANVQSTPQDKEGSAKSRVAVLKEQTSGQKPAPTAATTEQTQKGDK